MTVVLVPPLADPSTRIEVHPSEQLLDLNRRFAHRAGAPAVLRALAARLDRPGLADAGRSDPGVLAPAQRCLLALAAADALAAPLSAAARLVALGAGIRALSADDAGLTATLDDVTLPGGSTQSSQDTLLAAERSTVFTPEWAEVDGLLRLPAGSGPTVVEIVVDVDQQLPAAFQLVRRLVPHVEVTLGGRFVAHHLATLGSLPALRGVRMSGQVRRRVVRAEYLPPDVPEPTWVAAPADLADSGPWAGWLEAADVASLPPESWDRCRGLVVTAAGPADLGVAARVLSRLTGRVPLALEIVVGGPQEPGGSPSGADDAWWHPWEDRLRIAGFRPYRRPVGVAPAAPGHDLARWAAEPPGEHDRGDDLPPAWALDRYDLFPGRVAGALFAEPYRRSHPTGDQAGPAGPVGPGDPGDDVAPVPGQDRYQIDQAVRAVRVHEASPDGRGPGDFLVDLRTGRISRISSSLARLVRGLGRAEPDPPPLSALGARPDGTLVAGLFRAGVLRREPAA